MCIYTELTWSPQGFLGEVKLFPLHKLWWCNVALLGKNFVLLYEFWECSDHEDKVINHTAVLDLFHVLFVVISCRLLITLLLYFFIVDNDFLMKNHISTKGELNRGIWWIALHCCLRYVGPCLSNGVGTPDEDRAFKSSAMKLIAKGKLKSFDVGVYFGIFSITWDGFNPITFKNSLKLISNEFAFIIINNLLGFRVLHLTWQWISHWNSELSLFLYWRNVP